MSGLFEKRDRWGNSPALYVVALMLLLAPLMAYYGARSIHFDNDVRDWLPSGDQSARILNWHDDHFERYDTFLVTWDDSTLNDPRVEQFVERLENVEVRIDDDERSDPVPAVHGVTSPVELLDRMIEGGVSEEEAIERLQGVLIGTGFLKIRLTDAGRARREQVERRLRDYFAEEYDEELHILPPVTDASAVEAESADGTGREQLRFPPPPPHDFQLRWPGVFPDAPQVQPLCRYARSLEADEQPLVEDCFFASGAPVAIFVRLTHEGSQKLGEALEGVRQAAAHAGIDEERLRMVGTPVGQHRLDVEASKTHWNREAPAWKVWERSPLLMSGIVGMTVALVVLRSLRLAVLVLSASCYIALACMLLIPLSGRQLNIVLSVMPNLLLVLTASGTIHVANYWKTAVDHRAANPVARAVHIARRPCSMASFTTAIGMASLLASSLVPVREFGLYSALGVMLSLLMILYGFPSLLAVFGGLPKRFADIDTSLWRRFGRKLARHHLAWTLLFGGLLVVGLYGLRYFHTQTKAIRYFPEHLRIVHDYDMVEEALAGVVTIDTVLYFDEAARERFDVLERIEIVRDVEQAVRGTEGVSGAISLADFRERTEPPDEDAATFARIRYRQRMRRTQEALFEEGVQGSGQLVTRVQRPLEFTRDGETFEFVPGGDPAADSDGSSDDRNEIWRIRAQTEMMSDLDYGEFVADLNDRVAAAVEQSIAERTGGGEQSPAAVDVGYVVTGMVPLFMRTQEAVIESLIVSFGLAFVAIAITMMLLLRSVTSGLLSMIPNVWPPTVVFGMISLAGVPIDIGTMITASVAMGIAVDGTVHLLTWFREGILEGHDRREAMSRALVHCGPALWQTSAAIALAMLMLIFVDLLLISRFGWIMSASVGAALLADIALTPALLAGPLGGLIERKLRKQREKEQHEPSTSTAPSPAAPAAVGHADDDADRSS